MAAKRFAGANTRNVCILAHVDHGKSSYADSLLAANHIISPRLAGQLRYLDSREDEIERGITMESSAVSLAYKVLKKDEEGKPLVEDYRINVIDTPGHVDFSSEVSTASRLCDGALILVDAVEGVCTQTIAVLRQAWHERLRPLLVINKLDRLITELKLTPTEAYHYLTKLLEQVNAVMGSFFASERMEDDLRWREERERRLEAKKDELADVLVEKANAEAPAAEADEFEERDDEDIYFDPAKGDVLFASAVDGWAFRPSRFAQLWAQKLGIQESNLSRFLWGDFYLDPKSKRVLSRKQAGNRNLKPMFVQFVLDNIWAAYDAIALNPDRTKVDKIIKTLDLKIRPQDLKAKDTRALLSVVFSQWLPLASSTFRAIVEKVPAPAVAQAYRIPKMLNPNLPNVSTAVAPTNQLERDLFSCTPGDGAALVAYVSKMFAVPVEDLPQNQRRQLTAEEMRQRGREAREQAQREAELEAATGAVVISPAEAERRALAATASDALPGSNGGGETPAPEAGGSAAPQEALIGFARLYSGTIRVGQTLCCVLPKYATSLPPSHARNAKHASEITVEHLYLIMGRELISVDQVPAGNVFGIGGLEGKVLRNATLCGAPASVVKGSRDSQREWLVNLAGLHLMPAPIVRVSLEPRQPADMPKLVEGLRLLNQADPCVETLVQGTGEHVIVCAGELHLERCLRDLRERFAKIQIQASKPIVPFRETAIRAPDMAPVKTKDAPRGTMHGSVQDGLLTYTIRARPLPDAVTEFLTAHPESIKRIQHGERKGAEDDALLDAAAAVGGSADVHQVLQAEAFWSRLEGLFQGAGRDWEGAAEAVWAFGPRSLGPNVLLDRLPGSTRSLRRKKGAQRAGTAAVGSGAATPLPQTASGAALPDLASAVAVEAAAEAETNGPPGPASVDLREFDDSFDTAFQLAMLRGPLCAEPVTGMAFSVEALEVDAAKASLETMRARWSQLTGALISSIRDSLHAAMLDWSPRLLLAMYSCDIQAAAEVLGKVYGVVSRRRGAIVAEEMREGAACYSIRARLPAAEAFGFGAEIRKRTSGAAAPQLVFAGFERLDVDPYWVPTTGVELEDLGEKSDRENVARRYMDQVRKRKGMFVERKIVEHAEKQRTMKR